MDRILILYQSRTGFTERYARWLGEALEAPAIPLRDYSKGLEQAYEVLVCGGPVYGNELDGLKTFRRIRKGAPDKRFLYFATGVRPDSPRTRRLVLGYNFKEKEQPELYYFQGGLCQERLEPGQKALLTGFRSMIQRRRDLQEEDRSLLERLHTDGDYTDEAQIAPLVERLKH